MSNTINVQYEYEDELPEKLSLDEYSKMFDSSVVDGVRMFPYVIIDREKYYLTGVEKWKQ